MPEETVYEGDGGASATRGSASPHSMNAPAIRNRRSVFIGVAVMVGALVLGACGSSDDSSGAATTAAGAASTAAGQATTVAGSANTLTIENLSFSALTVKAGDTISIVNKDTVNHTVTADDGSFDVAVAAGATETLVIPTAGTYAIHCKIHSSMHGSIVVS